ASRSTAAAQLLTRDVLAQLVLADGGQVHFVRTVGQAQGALTGIPVRQREVVGNAGTAVDLNGAVDDAQRHVRSHHLDLGDFAGGDLVADGVHHVGSVQGQQASLVDLDARTGDVLQVGTQHGQRLAEGGTVHGAFAHQLQSTLGNTDGTHAVVDTARAEATLGDLEAADLTEQHVLVGNADVLQQHF